jgi:hypothetical protein
MKDELRDQLIHLLDGGHAHASFDDCVKDMPAGLQGKKPAGCEHSVWELLEHLRIAQWDMLEFTRNPKHVSPDWPKGYWPAAEAPPDANAWKKSVDAFRKDLKAFRDLVEDEKSDLLAPIPFANDKSLLRNVLLVADHNAYHLGQIVDVRRLLGAWH